MGRTAWWLGIVLAAGCSGGEAEELAESKRALATCQAARAEREAELKTCQAEREEDEKKLRECRADKQEPEPAGSAAPGRRGAKELGF